MQPKSYAILYTHKINGLTEISAAACSSGAVQAQHGAVRGRLGGQKVQSIKMLEIIKYNSVKKQINTMYAKVVFAVKPLQLIMND